MDIFIARCQIHRDFSIVAFKSVSGKRSSSCALAGAAAAAVAAAAELVGQAAEVSFGQRERERGKQTGRNCRQARTRLAARSISRERKRESARHLHPPPALARRPTGTPVRTLIPKSGQRHSCSMKLTRKGPTLTSIKRMLCEQCYIPKFRDQHKKH